MREEELTNNEKDANKTFEPKTDVIISIKTICLSITLVLSIVGLISISIMLVLKLGLFSLWLELLFIIILLVIFYIYHKFFSKIIVYYKIDRIFLYIIIFANILTSITIINGFVFGYLSLFEMHKPAIYLYPKKTSEVSITLDPSIKLDIDIPRYVANKGWKVIAYPDGKLIDLQPEYTNCSKLETHIFGLEYAKKACELNNYPYIFWEGKQTTKTLTTKNEGWIIRKEDTKRFLENKLNLVGFNDAEKKEFLAYWVPKILELKQEKVFIYFAQNEEINEYLPMKITPQPDTINRFYIIVDTRNTKYTNVNTQKLVPFRRQGFSVIDWGGCLIK